jgi:hypothetical protein
MGITTAPARRPPDRDATSLRRRQRDARGPLAADLLSDTTGYILGTVLGVTSGVPAMAA